MPPLICLLLLFFVLNSPALAQAPQPLPPVGPPAISENAIEAETQTPPALSPADLDAWLDGFLPFALKDGGIVGAVVVVVRDGQILIERGYGFADAEARRLVDPATTLFRIGSVTKLYTWTAVMQLVERGLLNLDRNVNAYLDFSLPAPDGNPITLRHLMTHRAGFADVYKDLFIADPAALEPLGQVLRQQSPELIFAPGATPAYSNFGAALAGYIVERVSGMPFDDYVEQNILQPLGAAHTTTRQPLPETLAPLMSQGYAQAGSPARRFEVLGTPPAGSISASGRDMARFMIAHLESGGPLLRPETAELMQAPAAETMSGLNRMALGFYEARRENPRVIGHGGDTYWFHSHLWLLPEHDVGIFLCMNSAGKPGATSTIRRSLLEGFLERYFPASDQGAASASNPADASLIAGHYYSSRRQAHSALSLGRLLAQFSLSAAPNGSLVLLGPAGFGEGAMHLVPVGPGRWQDRESGEILAAEVDNGEVERLALNSSAPVAVMHPVPWQQSAGWLLPSFFASVGTVLVLVLQWPASALARRHYGVLLGLSGLGKLAYYGLRGTALFDLLVIAGWLFLSSALFADAGLMDGRFDPMLVALQIGALIGFPALLLLSLWNLGLALLRRRLVSIAAVLAILLASCVLVWIGISFEMFRISTQY